YVAGLHPVWAGAEDVGGQLREALLRMVELHRWQQVGVAVLQRERHGVAAGGSALPLGEEVSNLLICLVLKQPGEQEVAGLQQLQVGLVVDLAPGNQASSLQIQQRGGDEQELRDLIQILGRLGQPPGISDELVGNLGKRDLRDVQLVRVNQLKQQVEGSVEVGERDPEARKLRLLGICHANLLFCHHVDQRGAWPSAARRRAE